MSTGSNLVWEQFRLKFSRTYDWGLERSTPSATLKHPIFFFTNPPPPPPPHHHSWHLQLHGLWPQPWLLSIACTLLSNSLGLLWRAFVMSPGPHRCLCLPSTELPAGGLLLPWHQVPMERSPMSSPMSAQMSQVLPRPPAWWKGCQRGIGTWAKAKEWPLPWPSASLHWLAPNCISCFQTQNVSSKDLSFSGFPSNHREFPSTTSLYSRFSVKPKLLPLLSASQV